MLTIPVYAPIQKLNDKDISHYGVQLFIKREDLIHKHISGNKWRKLLYNIEEARSSSKDTILTFGGAFSNHIAATAFAGMEFGFKTIGIIRGEKYDPLNKTLAFASSCGMRLVYVSREEYKNKEESKFIENLKSIHGDFFLLPEGGANAAGVAGCKKILEDVNTHFDYVCCSCGTGTTLAGIILSLKDDQKAIGFSSLKGGKFLNEQLKKWLGHFKEGKRTNWEINNDYHLGGYARKTIPLMQFITGFEQRNLVPLDFVYTGKMIYGIYDLIRSGYFKKGESVLAIHTGGLQGNESIQ
jgi:1-aminocyclopropane-1-carboxylate deaminase